MTRDDIIRMAREAGLSNDFGHLGYPYLPELERFAALVAAAEREQIIALNAPEIERINEYIKVLEDAFAAERETCARMFEPVDESLADEIRARGEK